MKQIVEQLNKIAKKIDANVDIPDSDLIIDSLDAITKAYGGTPNDSNLIVDKLEDIAGVASKGGGGGSSEIALIPEQTVSLEPYGEGTPLGIAELTGVTIDPEAHFSAIPVKIALKSNMRKFPHRKILKILTMRDMTLLFTLIIA